jgi:hypothetical protein
LNVPSNIHVSCEGNEFANNLTHVSNGIMKWIPKLQELILVFNDINTAIKALTILTEHRHNHHNHYITGREESAIHMADDYVLAGDKNRMNLKTANPVIDCLLQEFESNEDLNGDDEIYGQDFIFDPREYVPRAFTQILRDLDSLKVIPKNIRRISFKDYVENMNNSLYKDGLAANEVAGFKPANFLANELLRGKDTDNNGLVYGKDFIIDDKDPDKPPLLKQFEKGVTTDHRDPNYNDPTIKGPRKLSTRKLSWGHYLSTISKPKEIIDGKQPSTPKNPSRGCD